MPRPAVFAVALAAAATLAAVGPTSHGQSASGRAAASNRLLGITGSIGRFKDQTGQVSQVHQAFLGWNQGLTYGAPFASLIPMFGPIPMLHLGTGGPLGQAKKEIITPGQIAAGRGDGYLIALNKAIANWGKGIYVRPMAEMNNAGTLWSGYRADGSPKDANHSPAAYKRAFARIYLILHGGSSDAVDAKLRSLGMPPVSGTLFPNPFPRLRIVWSPLASDNPRVPGNAAQNYYPGSAYVDVEGGDIYDERLTDTAPWNGLEALFRAAVGRGKPFSVPEWGLIGVDDPAFVKHMCSFAVTHKATEMLAYYNSAAGSPFDLGSKPQSRAQYRKCLTPLRGSYPDWAASNEPGAGPKVIRLTLTANPAAGSSPLAVQFAIDAKLSVPIVQWQLYFGDGQSTSGSGAPPTSVAHTYAADALYHATLIVYATPPFNPASAKFLAGADVTAGTAPTPLIAIKVTPSQSPLALTFQIDLKLPTQPSSWQISWGDGKSDQGSGNPPHFTGHTYAATGTYQVVLVVQAPSGTYVTLQSVTVAVQPAQGTVTGTVLVNGAPFTGGQIPYGSKVDVTNGRLTIKTDVGTLLVFGNGVTAQFVLLHLKVGKKTVVELRLVGGNFGVCKSKRRTSGSTGSTAKRKRVRALWGSGKGSFRTRGRNAAATVRGTKWLTTDFCTGTQVRVAQGVVQVNDLVKHKLVLVRAGHSYFARAK